jgi:hypothetical protein
MTNTSVSTHDAKTIEFRAVPHTTNHKGGWFSVTVGTGKNEYSTTDPVTFTVHTWDPEMFDHFCDIVRIASGPIGALRPEPEEAPNGGHPK